MVVEIYVQYKANYKSDLDVKFPARRNDIIN